MEDSTKTQSIRWTQRLAAGLIALAVLLAAPGAAAAQDGDARATFDPRAGIGFAVGDLSKTHNIGFAGGLGVAYEVHPHISLRGDFDLMMLDEDRPQFGVVLAPPLTMIHYHAGLQFDFPEPRYQTIPLSLRWSLGAGGTSMSADRDFPGEQDVDFSGTYPSMNSALKIGYRLDPQVDLFVSGQIFLTFADDEEIAELVKRSSVQPYGTVWSLPLTLGANITLQ